jgi:hypothetical protein
MSIICSRSCFFQGGNLDVCGTALTFSPCFEQVADLENALELSCKALAEKVAVQTVAARLAEERDDALKELAELRQVS